LKQTFVVLCGVVCAVCLWTIIWFANVVLAPLFLDSRIERLHETGLPKALVEKGGIIYCRMKADDFRFPLPPGSHAVIPIRITGGFDTVDGAVEARFEGSNGITAGEYRSWLANRLQAGGSVVVKPVPGGLAIKFHYFGDR